MKFCMWLRYALGRVISKLKKIQIGGDFIVQTIVHISNCIEPANFILGTNIQQHKVYLMIKVKVTLTYADGHMCRSKVTKMN